MAAAAAEGDTLDGCFANQTRLAFPPVDPMLQLEKSLFAIGVNVVGDRRPAQCDCLFQHLLDGQIEAPQLLLSQRRRSPPRTNGRAKQRLISINVTHTAQQLLVEKGALDRRLTSLKDLNKLFEFDL